MGPWGFWMPGFMQFITGVYLMVGLTWFNVFGAAKNTTPDYMALSSVEDQLVLLLFDKAA
jgi:hypothetical protein